MSVPQTPSIGPKPTAAKPDLQAPGTVAPAASTKGTQAIDRLEARALNPAASLSGPTAPDVSTVPGIPERFPINALSELKATGLAGQTFMLDGGSLRGLELAVRRVQDDGQPGFELSFRITSAKLKPLLKTIDKRSPKRDRLRFRGAEMNTEGIARYTHDRADLTAASSHNPKDLDTHQDKWLLRVKGPKGGTVEVVHDTAAHAVRGFVRINLRGNDDVCTTQLQGMLKTLGIGHLFAPPTPRSKRVNLLMGALWQVDHAAAKKQFGGDPDKLKVADIEAALKRAGFDQPRIDALRYEEVSPGHFATVDPAQADAMARAGARYLYSTVNSPEHVLSMLSGGQKSSLRRFSEGQIVTGMSTNSDFSSGGAVGVFTRLVTQSAIYDEHSWSGRTYKLLQTHEQLGRTDWYGWDSDYFGRRWGLGSDNFGTSLVQKIDSGSYSSTNELIFTSGNQPQNVERVVATTANDRDKLIEHLNANDFKPHNGLIIEEFVVLSPKFMLFGPKPYEISNPAAFADQALERAATGDLASLQYFLIEGPQDGGIREKTEARTLASDEPKVRNVAMHAAKLNGRFSQPPEQVDAFVQGLQARADVEIPPPADGETLTEAQLAARKDSDDARGILSKLVDVCPAALFRVDGKATTALLAKTTPNQYSPFGLNDNSWVALYQDLARDQAGKKRSPAFNLALRTRARALLATGHRGFLSFLEARPLISPKDPEAWFDQQMAKLGTSGSAETNLALFLAQAKDPKTIGWAQARLIAADNDNALGLLKGTLAKTPDIGLEHGELPRLLAGLPAASSTRSYLLNDAPEALLRTGDPQVLEMLLEHADAENRPDFGIQMGVSWTGIVDLLLNASDGEITPYIRTVLERGARKLILDSEFKDRLATLKLHDGDTPDAAVTIAKKALGTLETDPGAYLELCWALFAAEPESSQLYEIASAVFEADEGLGHQIFDRFRSHQDQGQLPLSPKQMSNLVMDLHHSDSSGLRRLMSGCGRQIVLGASADLLSVLQSRVGDEGLAPLGLTGHAVPLFEQTRSRSGPDADALRAFLLHNGAGQALKTNEEAFLKHLKDANLNLGSLGYDSAWAADLIRRTVEDSSYTFTEKTYSDRPMPAGVNWLLRAGGESYDDTVLQALEQSLPGWKWKRGLQKGFVSRCEGLSSDWQKRLRKARSGWFW